MADLGALGTRFPSGLAYPLGRVAASLDRSRNPVRARLAPALVPLGWEEDDQSLGGHVTLAGGAGAAREIRALHRPTGAVIACTVSSAVDGAFLIRVPPLAGVDLHILAEPGDGCDAYLPRRTPVDD